MSRRIAPHHSRSGRTGVLFALSFALWVSALGCSDDAGTVGGTGAGSGSGGDGAAGGAATGGSGVGANGTGGSSTGGSATGGGATGGSATGGGAAGGMGGAPPLAGPPGTESVSGGAVCVSPSYRMIVTVGQPTVNQGTTTSPNYRLQGGLVGANESLP